MAATRGVQSVTFGRCRTTAHTHQASFDSVQVASHIPAMQAPLAFPITRECIHQMMAVSHWRVMHIMSSHLAEKVMPLPYANFKLPYTTLTSCSRALMIDRNTV